MRKLEADKAAADKAASDKAAEDQLKAALDEAMAKGAEVERERNEVWRDAEAFIAEEQRDAMRKADIHDILVAAVGDKVPNAKDAEDGYLRGAPVGHGSEPLQLQRSPARGTTS